MRTECKCHGLSGSCTLRTCWRKMPSFRDVGNRLKERFDGAAKVIPSNDGRRFIPEGATIKPPGRVDLVYSEESPDFCRANRKTGSLGTQGRECNATSPGVDGCELLCCGRGYKTRKVLEKVNCNCVFRWCCEVMCKTCETMRAVNTCRWESHSNNNVGRRSSYQYLRSRMNQGICTSVHALIKCTHIGLLNIIALLEHLQQFVII